MNFDACIRLNAWGLRRPFGPERSRKQTASRGTRSPFTLIEVLTSLSVEAPAPPPC